MTMLDYPDQLACIVWFSGCSMHCPYCYNPDIVNAETGSMVEADLFCFLNQRRGLLDGVVLSGGECTDYLNIVSVCRDIKKLGFKIKLDTNGTNPNTLSELLCSDLIDYVALDYKAPESKFKDVTGYRAFEPFSRSLDLLINSSVQFEVRTTVHTGILSEIDINDIIKDLVKRGYNNCYYLQKFVEATNTLGLVPSQKKWIDISSLSSDLRVIIRSG
jgi:pyruvate formate lyase activating enzyme